jgi:hypothetical protein
MTANAANRANWFEAKREARRQAEARDCDDRFERYEHYLSTLPARDPEREKPDGTP